MFDFKIVIKLMYNKLFLVIRPNSCIFAAMKNYEKQDNINIK